MCYGIYKYIGTDLTGFKNETKLLEAYNDTLATINLIVKNDKQAHESHGKTFSYNAYFKKPKSKIDFDKIKNIIESDTLFEDVKGIR
jgi:hypothetical protein